MTKIKIIPLLMLLAFAPAAALSAQTTHKKTAASSAKKKAAAVKISTVTATADTQPAGQETVPAAAVQAATAAPAPAAEVQPDPVAAARAKLTSGDAAERRQGVGFLAQSRNPAYAPELMNALSDESPAVRRTAAEGLGLLSWRDASPKLAELLTEDKEASVRQQAAIALSYLADPASGPALMKALKDKSPSVRYASLHTLGTIRYAQAGDAIIELLHSPDANTSRSAISALGMLQSTKAVSAILPELASSDQYIRLEAARALGDIGDKSAAPELQKRLAAPEGPAVRVEAALALAKMGLNDGLSTAVELVKSSDLSIKSQAINVLAAVGDSSSLALLNDMYAAEADPGVKDMLDFARQRLMAAQAAGQKK